MNPRFGVAFIDRWNLFEVRTEAASKENICCIPISDADSTKRRARIIIRCSRENDIQFAIGDGLSVTAVAAQVPALLAAAREEAQARGLDGRQSVRDSPLPRRRPQRNRRSARAESRILLIGERPGLATAGNCPPTWPTSLRAHTDANRNLISNIHSRGLIPKAAADILNFAAQMMALRMSGLIISAFGKNCRWHPLAAIPT